MNNQENNYTNQEDTKVIDNLEQDQDNLNSPENINEDKEEYSENSPEQEKKPLLTKKQKLIITYICLGIVVVLIGVYTWGVIYYHSHFLPSTEVNAINVSGKSAQEALTTVDNNFIERTVMLYSDAGTDIVSGSDIGLNFDNSLEDLEQLIKEQNTFAWPLRLFASHEIDLYSDYTVNEEELNSIINGLSIVSGPNVIPPKNATISYNGSEYVIEPAVEGDQPDVDKLKEAVIHALIVGDESVNLKDLDIYKTPDIKDNNEQLIQNLDKLNTALNSVITINFPSAQVVLNKDNFQPWLEVVDNSVTVNNNSLSEYVADLANKYNTAGKDIYFRATNGTTYSFRDDSGWLLNQQGEIDQLRSAILAGAVTTEDPVWSQEGQNSLTSDIVSGNYIEVSLAQQHLWLYKNNTLTMSSDIVSGCVQRNQSTQTGLFFIKEKNTNVTLTVYMPDGTQQNTSIKYWMPYSTTNGIEGVNFRTQFGGDIYLTQGTDGDIDIPEDSANSLFNNIDVGIPVVIY